MTTNKIAKMAIIIALYVALTYGFAFMSFGNIQFRISEILVLLAFFRKDYIVPLVIATAIANLFSSLGAIDLAFGSIGTLLGVLGIYAISKSKITNFNVKLFLASLMPVLSNGLLVAWELKIVFDYPFWPSLLTVALGEFVVVSIVGVLLFIRIHHNQKIMHYVMNDSQIEY